MACHPVANDRTLEAINYFNALAKFLGLGSDDFFAIRKFVDEAVKSGPAKFDERFMAINGESKFFQDAEQFVLTPQQLIVVGGGGDFVVYKSLPDEINSIWTVDPIEGHQLSKVLVFKSDASFLPLGKLFELLNCLRDPSSCFYLIQESTNSRIQFDVHMLEKDQAAATVKRIKRGDQPISVLPLKFKGELFDWTAKFDQVLQIVAGDEATDLEIRAVDFFNALARFFRLQIKEEADVQINSFMTFLHKQVAFMTDMEKHSQRQIPWGDKFIAIGGGDRIFALTPQQLIAFGSSDFLQVLHFYNPQHGAPPCDVPRLGSEMFTRLEVAFNKARSNSKYERRQIDQLRCAWAVDPLSGQRTTATVVFERRALAFPELFDLLETLLDASSGHLELRSSGDGKSITLVHEARSTMRRTME